MTRRRPPVVRVDAMDEADFERVMRDSTTLTTLAEEGARLMPDFRELLGDLFAACVKMQVEVTPDAELPPSAAVRARLVRSVLDSGAYVRLHEVTRLRPAAAGLATLRLGQNALAELRAGRMMLPRELRDAWDADAREDDVARLREEAASAEELAQARGEDDPVGRAAEAEAKVLGEEADRAEGELGELSRAMAQAAQGIPNESLDRLQQSLERLAERLPEMAAGEAQMGSGEGGDGQESAVDALELSDRLMDHKVLERLSRLVGALRAEARAQRRKRVPKAKSEVYGVTQGDDLGHLLPVELAAMRHPVLHRDFKRRFVEKELLTYNVRGEDHEGRGPAVICLDVSGSMAGKKAIWAKAVALTLADLARRDGRAVTVLTFSSGPVKHFELVGDRRATIGRPKMARRPLLEFAEQRVGGGTDFRQPLEDAADIIRTSRRHRRADVVLITDGAADLGAKHIEAFDAFKAETDSRCIGVLIDVADHQTETLDAICDEITRISELDVAGTRRIFDAFDRGR